MRARKDNVVGQEMGMQKLRYNVRSPDRSMLRQAVLNRFKLGWSVVERSDFDGQLLAQGFAESVIEFIEPVPPLPNWQKGFMMAVFELLWQSLLKGSFALVDRGV
jgi:hypothetical protein